MSWMNITCGQCGHEANIDNWTSTPAMGELPHGIYQCPHCRFAFKRQQQTGKRVSNEFYPPGEVTLTPVQPWL